MSPGFNRKLRWYNVIPYTTAGGNSGNFLHGTLRGILFKFSGCEKIVQVAITYRTEVTDLHKSSFQIQLFLKVQRKTMIISQQ